MQAVPPGDYLVRAIDWEASTSSAWHTVSLTSGGRQSLEMGLDQEIATVVVSFPDGASEDLVMQVAPEAAGGLVFERTVKAGTKLLSLFVTSGQCNLTFDPEIYAPESLEARGSNNRVSVKRLSEGAKK